MPATTRQSNKTVVLKGIIAIVILLFGVAFTSVPVISRLLGLQNMEARFFISRILYWGCLVFVWYYCTNIEKQKLLLWPEKRQPFWVYFLSMIVMYFVLSAGQLFIYKLFTLTGIKINQARETVMIEMLRGKYWLIFIASLTAGVVEELIFRAYLIPRLAVLLNATYPAVVISSVLFGLFHFGYYSWYHIAGTFFIGLVFALHYVKYRNIKILIIFHFLYDLTLLLLKAR